LLRAGAGDRELEGKKKGNCADPLEEGAPTRQRTRGAVWDVLFNVHSARSLFSERIRGVRDRGANSRICAASANVSAHRGVTSSRVGVGLDSSNATADMIWPDWQ